MGRADVCTYPLSSLRLFVVILHQLAGLDELLHALQRVLPRRERLDVGGEERRDGVDLRRRQAAELADLVLEQRHELRQVAPVLAALHHARGGGRVDVHKVVRLVDDLVLDHRLQHVLQTDHARDLLLP